MKNKKLIIKVLLAMLSTSLISINSIDVAHASISPQTWSFDYKGSVQTFTAPSNGTYLLETWGAEGGTSYNSAWYGGKGGYAKGSVKLNAGQTIYIYVGGKGSNANTNSTSVAGWNGGGIATEGLDGSGGGATDFRINGQALSNRVLVAGGGGGADDGGYGGYGGGLVGGDGQNGGGKGGTQTSGGLGGTYGTTSPSGTLGQGGKGGNSAPGGGGGYYGGGGGADTAIGAGGGSSYIGGVTDGVTIAGNTSFTSPTGSSEVGHTGSGYAKITMLSSPNINTKSTVVIGTFNSTMIDVSVPAVNSFTFNPNTNDFTVQNIQINNNSSAPVYASIKQIAISPTSEWIPSLVSPTTYTDNGWNNLSQSDTKSKVALGISAVSNSNWLNGIQNQNIWSTDLTNGVKVGAIRTTSSVSVTPTLKVGRAITNEKTLTSNYVFEFGLE